MLNIKCPKCNDNLFIDRYTNEIFCLSCSIRADNKESIVKLAKAIADRLESEESVCKCSKCGTSTKLRNLYIFRKNGCLTGYVCLRCRQEEERRDAQKVMVS